MLCLLMCYSDLLIETTAILLNAAVAPGHLLSPTQTFGPGTELTTGATNSNLFWHVLAVLSVWATCGDSHITVTKVAEVSRVLYQLIYD